MYGALQASLRGLLDAVRKGMRNAGSDKALEVGVTAFVHYLVSDPPRRGSCCSRASARHPR